MPDNKLEPLPPEGGDLQLVVAEVEAFLAHLEGHGSLVFGRGKTLRPEKLRLILAALTATTQRAEAAEAERDAAVKALGALVAECELASRKNELSDYITDRALSLARSALPAEGTGR